MKVGLTYACMNLKNLAKILAKKEQKTYDMLHSLIKETRNSIHTEKLVLELNSSTNFVYSLKAARSGGLNFNGNIVGFLSWPSFFFIHQFCKFLMWFTLVPISNTCNIILSFKQAFITYSNLLNRNF